MSTSMANGKAKEDKGTVQLRVAVPTMGTLFLIYVFVPLFLLGMFGAHERHTMGKMDSAETFNFNEVKKDDNVGSEVTGIESKSTVDNLLEVKKKREMKKPKNENEDSRRNAKEKKIKMFDDYIDKLRRNYKDNPSDPFTALFLAEGLRQRDLNIHDGGSTHEEGIAMYKLSIKEFEKKKEEKMRQGVRTDIPEGYGHDVALIEEYSLDFRERSMDGILCSAHSGLAKLYFMANMFENAVDEETRCLDLQPNNLESLSHQAACYIILGKYEKAADNYLKVIDLDKDGIVSDVYTGLTKILMARESAVQGGWKIMLDRLNRDLSEYMPKVKRLERELPDLQTSKNSDKQAELQQALQQQHFLYDKMKKIHLSLFSYHDTKSNNTRYAWSNLTKAFHYKMSVLPPWNTGLETQRTQTVMSIFHRSFWPKGVGSSSRTPIFVIGFVRTGSTLLERVLDAHSQVVGTGEDSVFNGRLDKIRNGIVEASLTQDHNAVLSVVEELADEVVDGMTSRWRSLQEREEKGKVNNRFTPKRFVDKMLLNYMNVGFIHMLFPKALILHVIRNPMDTLFSAYKHDFPPGTLDYTSQFSSLSELYTCYRDIMDHWDRVLPGRVTHIRYEDMVTDMPKTAKAIIKATGLQWEEDILNFHKKKHAVNTLSTTQVRKGVYSHHLEAWKKYEKQLQPLVKMIGKRVKYDKETSLFVKHRLKKLAQKQSEGYDDSDDDDDDDDSYDEDYN